MFSSLLSKHSSCLGKGNKGNRSSSRSFDGTLFVRMARRKVTKVVKKVRLSMNKQMPRPYIDEETDISYDVEVDEAVNPLNEQFNNNYMMNDDNDSDHDYYDYDDDDDFYDYPNKEDLKEPASKLTPVTKRGESSGSSDEEDEASVASQFYWETIGEILDDKYRVVDTLGKGTFGRVVECYEVNPNHWKEWLGLGHYFRGVWKRKTSDVYAVKIVRNKYTNDAKEEASVLRKVNNHHDKRNPDQRGKRYFPILYEEFTLPSRHYCLVMEKLGQSLYDVMQSNDFTPFPLAAVKSIAVQLLDALDYLHAACNIVHTDLKPENLLLVNTTSNSTYNHSKEHNADNRIKLIDLGSAVEDSDPRKSTIINTREYRAPEVLLELNNWSYPSDIWVAACVLFELSTSAFLFNPASTDEHLQLIETKIGKFPKHMITKCKSGSKDAFDIPLLPGNCSYNSSGSADSSSSVVGMLPENRILTTDLDSTKAITADKKGEMDRPGTLKSELGDVGNSGLYKLLSSCLQISPRARPKAKKALQLAKRIELDLSKYNKP